MSLQLLCNYGGSDSEEEEENEPTELMQTANNSMSTEIDDIVLDVMSTLLNKVERQFTKDYAKYRHSHLNETSDDSDSSLSGVWSPPESDTDELFDDISPKGPCVTKGELTLQDLPPIERLQITVPTQDLVQVGIVCSILHPLVIIQSFTNLPVLDLDSVLFSKDGSSLGKIFDVIGKVKQPNYVLRFNSQNEINEVYKLKINSPVYFAERCKQPVTKYVFMKALEEERGSDASWKFDNEPPPDEIDFSDDEAEKAAKWKRKAKLRKK